ncbi:bifunctional ADP-dependent NAD(P)H-hydrate dehydratase/NAD(P)H-hydrate epimerase [Saccharospirillum impatiens]|uniref:bifunctional ADP-dependent NAD(P)H-hydrate dehydratase/NAD(P)H-hydrate epimerase n=1 Tax=Saccharospirillum impatiens TaxID=169438 RepID=UPI00040CB723|nr:bifunctional ADP-dependent NAD(P)H-hydrate dehydratase/NAD(P)H-hydrate epimerase [Saccharospirillum impatiens]
MKPVLAAADVATVENAWASVQAGEDGTWPLMLAAGQAVARRVEALACDGTIWILAGKGNNGGDGYVAAWYLHQAGYDVRLIAPLGASRAGSDAERARRRWLDVGSEQATLPDSQPAVVIDALLGSGQQGPLAGSLAEMMMKVNRISASQLAVDVPTGLNANTGVADANAFQADQTLSFIAFKPGLLTGDGPGCVGELVLETLGIDAADWAQRLNLSIHWQMNTEPAWPARSPNGHKGGFGQVSIMAGSAGMGGAGLLAARAALAAGAGKVIWHTTHGIAQSALSAQPELMTATSDASSVPAAAIVVLGPGLGRTGEAYALCERLAQQCGAGVLDADGLSWLAAHPKALPGWVMTPHPGEAAALLGLSAAAVQADRCAAALALSERYEAVIVLKGAGSIIAEAGQLFFSHPGTVAMATPGMGDTLAGWIGGLMAQGFSSLQAACSATWWHAALAANLADQQRIVLASDLLPLMQAARPTSLDQGY